MATPTPIFPTAVASDAQLKVANNLTQATLRVAIDATNTVLFLDSAAGFAPNMLVSIDKEIIAIASVTTSPNATLTVASGGRGFDGTQAASHAAGAKVSVLIDAWHHNALAAEVKAIESAIGANLANVGHPVSGQLVSTDFIFPLQTPGGTVTGGIVNTITVSPVPRGVNGTDAGHYLYISGGTGTPESVLITGGTATSGATSGSLTFTPANSHSGAWTIQTATAGIQEAVQSLPANGGVVTIPTGNHALFATVHLGNGTQAGQSTRNGICLQGLGLGTSDTVGLRLGTSALQWFGPNGGTMVQVDGPIVGVRILNLMFEGTPSTTVAGTALFSMHAYEFRYQDLLATGVSGFAFDIQARGNQAGFAAGSQGVVDGMYTASLQGAGSGLNVGSSVYQSGYEDVAQVSFRNISLQVGPSGIGLQLQFVDSCEFNFVITMGGAIGLKVINPSGASNNFPTSITFKQTFFGGTTTVSLPSGWHPTPASDIYGGLLFEPWGAEVGGPPNADGVYGFTDNNQYFNFKLLTRPLTLANGANNDVAVGNAGVVRITGPSGPYSITGFAGGRDGRLLILVGNTGGVLTIANQNTGSAMGNRIAVPGNADLALSNGMHSAMFVYDAADNCWFFVSGK